MQFSARVAQQVAVTVLMLVGSNVCASMVWIGPRRRVIACCVQTSWGTTGSRSLVATKKSTSVALHSLSTHVVFIVHFAFNLCENSLNLLLFRQLQFFTDIM